MPLSHSQTAITQSYYISYALFVQRVKTGAVLAIDAVSMPLVAKTSTIVWGHPERSAC